MRLSKPRRDGASAGDLPLELDPGAGPEAEGPDHVVEPVPVHAIVDLRDADVAGELDHLRRGEPPVPMRVVDHLPGVVVGPVLAEEPVRGAHRPQLEGRRKGEHLEGRSGLEAVGQGTVLPRLRGGAGGSVRVERWRRRHREDLPRSGREHHGHAAAGVVLLHRRLKLALRDVLDVPVDREGDRVPLRIDLHGRRRGYDEAAPGVPLAEEGPPLAAQVPVQGELDSLHPLAVQVGEADEGRGQFPVRVEPFRLLDGPDAVDRRRLPMGFGVESAERLLHFPHRFLRGGGGHLTSHPHEPLLPGEQLPELLGGTGYPGGEEVGRLVGIAELRRLDEDRFRGDAHRELGSRPVQDHTPLGEEGDGGAVLLRAAVTDLPDPENLDLERPQYDEDVEGEEYAEDEARAGGHLTGSPGPSARAPCAGRSGRWRGCGRGSSAPAPPAGEPPAPSEGCASPPGRRKPGTPCGCTGPTARR